MATMDIPAPWGGLLVPFFGFINVPVQGRAGTVVNLCTEFLLASADNFLKNTVGCLEFFFPKYFEYRDHRSLSGRGTSESAD